MELRDHVANTIGPIAKPRSIVFTNDLPKTRSGKIMRRLAARHLEYRQLGDVTTLANADIVEEITGSGDNSSHRGIDKPGRPANLGRPVKPRHSACR